MHNLYEASRDLKTTKYFKEINELVFDPGIRPISFTQADGTVKNSTAAADADPNTGTITFFDEKGTKTNFDADTFYHEVGHLIANEVADDLENKWNPLNWLPRGQSADGGEIFNEAVDKEHAISDYGATHKHEAFAEAFEAFMLLDRKQMRETPQQFQALLKLGIPSTHAAAALKNMKTNLQY